MKIGAFTSDRAQVETWLNAMVASCTGEDQHASYWFHSDSNDFGLVISDFRVGNSGEFHLFADGRISISVEHGVEPVADGWHRVAHFHEFEDRFSDFKAKVNRTTQGEPNA